MLEKHDFFALVSNSTNKRFECSDSGNAMLARIVLDYTAVEISKFCDGKETVGFKNWTKNAKKNGSVGWPFFFCVLFL